MHAVVDAHVHVWDARRVTYPWLDETVPLGRVFTIDDVRAEHRAAGVEQIVLVQAADDLADTELMLEVAGAAPSVVGVVGWAPLRDPGAVRELLDHWADQPVVGLRHLVHRDPDPDFLLDEAVHRSLAELGRRGLTFDVCAETPHLLALVPQVAARHPDTTFVIDHLGKPPIRERGWTPWADLIGAAARMPNVVVKLSGLNTAAATDWTSADFAPYVDHALECFGPERTMYGGDWPFALLAASSYTQIWSGLRATLDGLSPGELDHVLHDTARRTYHLPSMPRG
jgi:L-fuconolactonase